MPTLVRTPAASASGYGCEPLELPAPPPDGQWAYTPPCCFITVQSAAVAPVMCAPKNGPSKAPSDSSHCAGVS